MKKMISDKEVKHLCAPQYPSLSVPKSLNLRASSKNSAPKCSMNVMFLSYNAK